MRGSRALAVTACVLLFAAGSSAVTRSGTAAGLPPADRPCALRAAPGTAMSEGFGDGGHDFAAATGDVRALTLMVDFPDKRAPYPAEERYREFFPAVRQWFHRASYGRLRYASTPVLRWIRMPRPFSAYGIGRGYGWNAHTAMMRDLLRVADKSIDFSGYSLVNVLVTPNAGPPADQAVLSVTWTGAAAATTDDGARLDRVSLIYGHDQSGARVLSHENGHAFGLPDLYSVDAFGRTDRLAGQWDSMSLDWGLQGDLFAWHKWRLGWLDDAQVLCVRDAATHLVRLSPVEVAGGRKAVVVPLGRTSAYVVEARAARGNDAEACREGVLVYRIRTDVDSGHGPVTVRDAHPATTACEYSSASFNSLNDAPFRPGEHFADPASGLTVEVLAHDPDDDGWTVRVTNRHPWRTEKARAAAHTATGALRREDARR
ncbi:M6 family metalloprotease domain-containing protein [Streptomyces sp. NPDC088732]|uniref:M6 family metalloprotease domain-containing protein n=1 Tax=Streptomyces sp. NPDC088732 TaxID=3365879 RepID=UPI00382BDC3A